MSLFKSYIKHYTDPHRGLSALSTAARRSKLITLIRNPMPIPWNVTKPWFSRILISALWKQFAHFLLAYRICKSADKVIVVREFLTLPTLIISPLLFWRRRTLWFLIHHNLDAATRRPLEHLALTILHRTGFNFVVFEDVSNWTKAGLKVAKRGRLAAIPSPMPGWNNQSDESAYMHDEAIIIGFVGSYRVEKSPEWALKLITESINCDNVLLKNCQLLVGSTDKKFLSAWSDTALTRNTNSYAAYCNALSECDVLVLPYERTSYYFRSSGVVAEAIQAGCCVLVPNFPTLSCQVKVPQPAGFTYAGKHDFLNQLAFAVKHSRSDELRSAAKAHREFRGIAGCLRTLELLATRSAEPVKG